MQKLVRSIFILLSLGGLLATPAAAGPTLPFIGAVFDSANLERVVLLAMSADGRYLYAASEFSNVLAVFSRDETTGMLSLVQKQRDNDGPVDGLDVANAVTISPDGAHVYATGLRDPAVATFSRDETSGKLQFVGIQPNRQNYILGLETPTSVTVSPDGRHVYMSSWSEEAVTAFNRNETTGELNFVETYKDGQNGIDGLDGAKRVTISPDGRHVYATGSREDTLVSFSRNETTGALSFIEVHKDGQNGLEAMGEATEITISPDGRYLYVTATLDNAVLTFGRNKTTGTLSFIEAHKDGQNGVDGLYGATAVTISPDGRYLYVSGFLDDAVAVFSRNKVTGRLNFIEVHKDDQQGVDGLNEASSIVVSPDGRYLYVAGTRDDAIAIFSRDETTGTLNWEAAQYDDDQGVNGLNGITSTAISPDGRHLYVTSTLDGGVATFSRDETTGQLNFIDYQEVSRIYDTTSAMVSPDGRYLYVTSQDGLVVFSRDETTGRLSLVQVFRDGQPGVVGLTGAWSVVVSADSRWIYVMARFEHAVVVFSRDETTGRLSPIEVYKNGENGIDGLDRVTAAAISPDDRHLYLTDWTEAAVVVFSRDGTTGRLSFVEVHKSGLNGVKGLTRASAVTVSPNGQYVYAASLDDHAIVVFSRDGTTGRLSFVEVYKEGERGVDGLIWASSLAFSPNGRYLYVAGAYDSAIALFWLFGESGRLSFAGVEKEGLNGVEGLNAASHVTVSPDGRHVYVASPGDKAVAIFLGRTGGDPIDFYLPVVGR